MNAKLLSLLLILPCLLFAADETIQIGQTKAEALKILGKPAGTVELGEKTRLLYPEGEITIEKDLVTHVALMNSEEYSEQEKQREKEREEWKIHQAQRAKEQLEEANKIKASKLSSKAFAALPAKDRVDYWRSFQIRYPQVDVSEQIAGALKGYQSELSELKTQEQIAELQARIAKAEQEAATAKVETQRALDEAEKAREDEAFRNSFRYRYYDGPYYRPNRVTIITPGYKPSEPSCPPEAVQPITPVIRSSTQSSSVRIITAP